MREDPLAIVINEAAARTYWPGQNAVGAYARLGGPDGTRVQVVGVVGDVRNDGLGNPSVPEVYLSSALVAINPMRFVVRSSSAAGDARPGGPARDPGHRPGAGDPRRGDDAATSCAIRRRSSASARS